MQGTAKLVSKMVMMAKNTKMAVLYLLSLAMFAWLCYTSVSYRLTACAPYRSLWPSNLVESVVDACRDRMLTRYILSPLHVMSLGFNVDAICTSRGVLWSPQLESDRQTVTYQTLFGTMKNMTLDDDLRVVMWQAAKHHGCSNGILGLGTK